MKRQIAILGAIVAATSFSAFGQGYVTFTAGARYVWDEFTTPGVGVRSANNVTVAFLWAATSATDSLTAVGDAANMGKDTGVVAPNKQVATNGVASISGWATIQSMISSGGWNWATNSGTGILVTQNTLGSGNIGGWNYGEFQLFGTTAGNAYQFIAIGWNSTSSMFASTALGWSDPFNYATGSSASDPLGTTSFSQGGMNQFGVAPVPEPSTIALAGLGGLSLLLFRRRK